MDQKLALSQAYDTYNNQSLNRDLSILAKARMTSIDNKKGSKSNPKLTDTFQLAKGTCVLVTYNIEMELDIAKGARSVIECIIIQGARHPLPSPTTPRQWT